MRARTILTAVASTFLAVGTLSAQGVMRGAATVSASAGLPAGYSAPTALGNIINQSGLSASYINGVTDFATFTGSTTASYSCCWNELGGVAGFPAWIQFDFGSIRTINSIVVWNQAGSASLNTFELSADNGVPMGVYAMGPNSQNFPQPAQVFAFAPVTTSFIRMNILSNYGYNGGTIVNEVAFSEVANAGVVPEPASVALMATGLVAVAGIARRRKNNA